MASTTEKSQYSWPCSHVFLDRYIKWRAHVLKAVFFLNTVLLLHFENNDVCFKSLV